MNDPSPSIERQSRERWSEGVALANEFTTVRLRVVETVQGARLEIHSAKLGHTIRLDPLALESLTWQDPELFSEFLRTPLGPIDQPD